MESFQIRHAVEEDLDQISIIYAKARQFMTDHGNPHQWADNSWPPVSLLQSDIEKNKTYVCLYDHKICAVFYYDYGKDIEPTYQVIEDGKWMDDSPYGVVHRIASDGSVKGSGTYCIQWAYEQCHHLRMDTHPDNHAMQNLMKKLDFVQCGIIHVKQDSYPRIAYEKVQ